MNARGAALSLVVLAGAALVPRALAWGPEFDTVSVNAGADPAYVRQKFPKEGPKAETYVLARGESFGGFTHDSSLENMQFADIARARSVPTSPSTATIRPRRPSAPTCSSSSIGASPLSTS